jgi:hypothetical protein
MPHVTPPREERGQATIEMIGVIPLAALIAGAIIQLYLVGYAAVSAESASRLAAREASKGDLSFGEAAAAGEGDVNGIFDPVVEVRSGNLSDGVEEPAVSYRGVRDPVSARATLTVPFLGIGVAGLDYHVTRFTVMPRTDQ